MLQVIITLMNDQRLVKNAANMVDLKKTVEDILNNGVVVDYDPKHVVHYPSSFIKFLIYPKSFKLPMSAN